MKFTPTLKVADFVIITALTMVALAIHQKVVAPKIAKK
jgi:hypothetical protein